MNRYDVLNSWVQNEELEELLRVLSGNRRTFVTAASLDSEML